MTVEHEFDAALTIQDRIRLRLNEFGSSYVPATPQTLATDLNMTRPYDVYQALARLQRQGEIELEKRDNRIVGITVKKLEPTGRTYQRAADKAKNNVQKVEDTDYTIGMTALKEYLHKKLAIAAMQEQAKKAGLDPETTVKFEPNPYAEEGIALLKLVGDAIEEVKRLKNDLQMTNFDLEAERRNVEFLKRQNRETTRSELIAAAN